MTNQPSESNVGGQRPMLGCIADDVTGATDVALNLVEGGMRVVQVLGVPTAADLVAARADAIVVALKSRAGPAERAVEMSRQALNILRHGGCRRFYFKYCSTFDSTERGNIGPVAEALLDELAADYTVFCPAFPDAGRTVYAGHLFVDECLLSESGMQDHPLNPMTDPDLVRVLARQVQRRVGLLRYQDVVAGTERVRTRIDALVGGGRPLIVTDALSNDHLRTVAAALHDLAFVTGGSGLARYLAEAYRQHGMLPGPRTPASAPVVAGRSAVLAGSCSPATRRQVDVFAAETHAWQVDVDRLMAEPDQSIETLRQWLDHQDLHQPVMVYSTAEPEAVAAGQARYGRGTVAQAVEQFHGRVAKMLAADYNVRRFVIAGGETAAAVAAALGIHALRIGPAIAPGVPWTETLGNCRLAIAFKSGNFGDDGFFRTALEMLT